MRISDWSSDVCSSDLRRSLPLMATVVALSMVAGASRLVPGIPAFFMPHKWTGVVVHDEARAALDQIGGTAAPRVETRWPLPALAIGHASGRERVWQYV